MRRLEGRPSLSREPMREMDYKVMSPPPDVTDVYGALKISFCVFFIFVRVNLRASSNHFPPAHSFTEFDFVSSFFDLILFVSDHVRNRDLNHKNNSDVSLETSWTHTGSEILHSITSQTMFHLFQMCNTFTLSPSVRRV